VAAGELVINSNLDDGAAMYEYFPKGRVHAVREKHKTTKIKRVVFINFNSSN
jgi:hypothetical protein